MAFESVDMDGSGDLDADELYVIMEEVSKQMGIKTPSAEDLNAIIRELDSSGDNKIDKEEFHQLIMMILSKMVEIEEEYQKKVNLDIQQDIKKKKEAEEKENPNCCYH